MLLMDDLLIRNFQIEDQRLVEAFFDGMSGESRAFFNRNDFNRKDALGFFEGRDHDCMRWLVLDKDCMVGYVYLWGLNKRVVWLGISVADDYKGRHLGRKLMQTAYEYAVLQNKGGILLSTHVANIRGQALYERCGYEPMGMYKDGEFLYMLNFDS
jgi:ribosomal protein S18 acetylase RimI-like enzyme